MKISLPSYFDVDTEIKPYKEKVDVSFKEEKNVIFDCSKTEFIDSSGLSIFIYAASKARTNGLSPKKVVFVIHANERVKRLMNMTGLSELIDVS